MKREFLHLRLLCGVLLDGVRGMDLSWTVGQSVRTSSGVVQGHPASTNTEVSEYLGIPYAIPPVGSLRWTAPQRYTGNSSINGTFFVSATAPRTCKKERNVYLGIFVSSAPFIV